MRLTARKPTEAELAEAMSNKPVYKVVRVVDDKLKSLWVEGTRKRPLRVSINSELMCLFALTYARGRLSSNGKYGIWCCKTMRSAYHQASANGCSSLCAIFKAYPIGEPIETPLGWGCLGTVLYPSVILGSRVVEYRDER